MHRIIRKAVSLHPSRRIVDVKIGFDAVTVVTSEDRGLEDSTVKQPVIGYPHEKPA